MRAYTGSPLNSTGLVSSAQERGPQQDADNCSSSSGTVVGRDMVTREASRLFLWVTGIQEGQVVTVRALTFTVEVGCWLENESL